MGVRKNVLVVSSDYTFASFLEQQLGLDFDVHSAATDMAAFALMDAYTYDCIVIDLSARSSAGSATVSGLQLNALTIPIFALVPPAGDEALPPEAIACINRDEPIPRLAGLIRKALP